MPRTDFDMQVAGLKELVVGLQTMQGPELGKVIADSARRTARSVAVPAMRRQMQADFKRPGSHRPPKKKDGSGERSTPKPGQGGPAERNVTVRSLRKRSGELVALSVGPRAWYAHWPIAGTRPHVIRASGVGGRASNAEVRRFNRLGGRASVEGISQALAFSGRYRTQVHHPGVRGTDSIRKAVVGIAPTMNARYVTDLQAAYDKHIAGPTRRAKPK